MATFGVDCGISYSHSPHSPGIGSEGDDDLLSTYSMLSPTQFQNMASFKKSIKSCYNGFVVGSSVHHQYMAFTDVTLKQFHKIDALRERWTSLPRMVVLYDGIEEVLIVKLRPSPLHSVAVMQFHDVLVAKFNELGIYNQIFALGNGRFGEANARCKEPDNAYSPTGRHYDDFPSFVVEVGVSESLQMLKNDARYWLIKSGGQTRIVIIIHIDEASRKILLQRWECVNVCPRRANVQYPPSIRVMQSLELEVGVQYVGDALEIPAIKVFDIVPNNLPDGEFVFTHQELQDFSEFLWSRY